VKLPKEGFICDRCCELSLNDLIFHLGCCYCSEKCKEDAIKHGDQTTYQTKAREKAQKEKEKSSPRAIESVRERKSPYPSTSKDVGASSVPKKVLREVAKKMKKRYKLK